jgi:O-methyltransferase involved in polyketide biosynthesis
LQGVSETLLMRLWARAGELDRPEPVVRKVRAREFLGAIDCDFEKFVEVRVDT